MGAAQSLRSGVVGLQHSATLAVRAYRAEATLHRGEVKPTLEDTARAILVDGTEDFDRYHSDNSHSAQPRFRHAQDSALRYPGPSALVHNLELAWIRFSLKFGAGRRELSDNQWLSGWGADEHSSSTGLINMTGRNTDVGRAE